MSRVNKPALCAPRDLRARTAERARNATQKATQKANRRRSWPRWTGVAMKLGMVALPIAMLGGAGPARPGPAAVRFLGRFLGGAPRTLGGAGAQIPWGAECWLVHA